MVRVVRSRDAGPPTGEDGQVTGQNGGSAGRNDGRVGEAERRRLTEDHVAWRRWGPYLAERAWGTVREDYSSDGTAWDYLSHDQARSRAYRWNEDGLAGVCDEAQRLCLALTLWNGHDPILKERMFGLTGPQGNHGEDAKEYWWYTDAVPSHAYLKWQYAYPLDGYPYQSVIDGNDASGLDQPEFELLDTGVFDPEPDGVDGSGRWADITVEYAKAAPDDIVMRIRVENRSVRPGVVHLLPTLWFRNTWAWGPAEGERGTIGVEDGLLVARHPSLGSMLLAASADPDGGSPRPLFCENESNAPRLWGAPRTTPWPKDGINDHIVAGRPTVNRALVGTKAALWYRLDLGPRRTAEVIVRLTAVPDDGIGGLVPDTGVRARAILDERQAEADDYHASLLPACVTDAERAVHRAAVAGLIWSKCFYHYDVDVWLDGDLCLPKPPAERLHGRNSGWRHLKSHDVLSMPDPWEFPWYAAWDLAFHTVALAHIDPEFAKQQLTLLLSERYLHPKGQLPAHEWAFDDVNPPMHAWAALRVFEIDGGTDFDFLEKVLRKLSLNFTWWVNRLEQFGGLEQIGGSAWLAMYCLDLWQICLRLSVSHDPVYANLASTFLERFAAIAEQLRDSELWNEADGFYNDIIVGDGGLTQVRVQSMVGLLPLFAVRVTDTGQLLSIVSPRKLSMILARVFDEARFLAPTGVRSLSKVHGYEPAESRSRAFGGNSNWRGPVWFPLNHLLIESLRRYAGWTGGSLQVEVPVGSGRRVGLAEAADELAARLISTFVPGPDDGVRPYARPDWDRMPALWRDRIAFHEYFHGDTGAGLGASHQTGWTALVIDLIATLAARRAAAEA